MIQFKTILAICILSMAMLFTTGCFKKKGCTNSYADNYDKKADECDDNCTYTIKYEITGSGNLELAYNWNSDDDRVKLCTTTPWSKTLVVDKQSCASYNIFLQLSPGWTLCGNPNSFQSDFDFSVTVNGILCETEHINAGDIGYPIVRCN